MLDKLLAPASVAVIGASDETKKPGGKIVSNILKKNYRGKLYLVNAKAGRIQGMDSVSSPAELPEVPELCYIATPARFVSRAMADLAALGARCVIILSAGFSEMNEEGAEEEKKILKIANDNGMLVLGPNCLGVTSPYLSGKFAGLMPDMIPGGIDFISGSGATVDYLIEQAIRRGLRFHSFVTVGNSAQNGITEMLGLYDENHGPDSSKLMMLYVEKINNPDKFLKHARSLAAKGVQIMGIKSGTTEAGSRAAASHTGALVTSDRAVSALFDKAGIIRVQSRMEMIDLAIALTLSRGRYDGRRVGVITDAGGPGVMAADELNRQGITVPAFGPETRRRLAEILPPGAGMGNPVDTMPSRNGRQLLEIMKVISQEEDLDYIFLITGDPGLIDNWEIYEAFIESRECIPIPVLPSFCTAISSAGTLKRFRELGHCHFEDEVFMARALSKMVNRPRPSVAEPDPSGYDGKKIKNLLAGISGVVPEALVRQTLSAAGIPTPAQAALTTKDELTKLPEEIPFPWVMKVIGPLHKSDLGGVLTGVAEPAAAEAAWDRLMALEQAAGVLVQQTIRGPEAILGLSREKPFGHLVACGLGGIHAEALKDIQFKLAPLSKTEADEMIDGIKGRAILTGMRGEKGMDLKALAGLLVRVSLLARDVPAISELDINPLKGEGGELLAVDSRIILE